MLVLLLLFVLKRFDVEFVFGKRLGAVLVCGVVKLKGFVEGVAWAVFVAVEGKREDVAGLLKRLLVVLNKPLLGAVVVLGAVVLVLLLVNEKGVVAAGCEKALLVVVALGKRLEVCCCCGCCV